MKKSILIGAFIVVILLIILGLDNSNKDKKTNSIISYNDKFVIEDKESLIAETLLFIEGKSNDDLKYFSNDLKLDPNDIVLSASLSTNYKTYYSSYVYYVQIQKTMFRFQLNREHKVESYIKYSIQA